MAYTHSLASIDSPNTFSSFNPSGLSLPRHKLEESTHAQINISFGPERPHESEDFL
jgi:hypothetical protein